MVHGGGRSDAQGIDMIELGILRLCQEVPLRLNMRHERTESLLACQHLHAWHGVHIVIILHIINEVGVHVGLELHLRFDLVVLNLP